MYGFKGARRQTRNRLREAFQGLLSGESAHAPQLVPHSVVISDGFELFDDPSNPIASLTQLISK